MEQHYVPADLRTHIAEMRQRARLAEEALRDYCGATESASTPHQFVPGGWQEPDPEGYYEYETCDQPRDAAVHLEGERLRREARWDEFAALVDEYGNLMYPEGPEEDRRRELEHTAEGRTELDRIAEKAGAVAMRVADMVIDLHLYRRPSDVG